MACSKVSKVANHPFSRQAKKKKSFCQTALTNLQTKSFPVGRQNTALQPFSSSQQVVLLMDGGPAFSYNLRVSTIVKTNLIGILGILATHLLLLWLILDSNEGETARCFQSKKTSQIGVIIVIENTQLKLNHHHFGTSKKT